MSWGIQIFNKVKKLIYDSTMVTWNQVDTAISSPYATYDTTFPVMAGKEALTMTFFVNGPPEDREAHAPTVMTWPNGRVAIFGGSESTITMIMAR